MRREKRSKLGREAPCCNNSSVHTACAEQCIAQQLSEWDVAPFLRVRFSRRVQCGQGLKKRETGIVLNFLLKSFIPFLFSALRIHNEEIRVLFLFVLNTNSLFINFDGIFQLN